MADLKGSKTEENLKAALAGESQARVKYEFYASQAKKDGYVEIRDIFQESSDNEKEHAKIWFKLLNGGGVPDTLTNLADAAAGEHEEWTSMYKEFAETAREEGFDDIAVLFDAAGATEKAHEDRYNALTDKVVDEDLSSLTLLYKESNQFIPKPLANLQIKKINFNNVITSDLMYNEVRSFIE
jgi:rubrerythrin